MSEVEKLVGILKDFMCRKDNSIEMADGISVSISNLFHNDTELERFEDDFASYQPGGGDYLFNFDDMVKKCKEILFILEERSLL